MKCGRWEYAEHKNASAVVAIAALFEGCLVLTEQFRIPVGRTVIDLPAGLVGDCTADSGELAQVAAERELLEETGFKAAIWTESLLVPSSPGLTSETVRIYLAERLEKISADGGVSSEEIIVHLVSLEEFDAQLEQWLSEGKLIDPKVFVALHLLR
ncbi:MAG: NUDIX hydrolase [Planctomycetaceae bacterium]